MHESSKRKRTNVVVTRGAIRTRGPQLRKSAPEARNRELSSALASLARARPLRTGGESSAGWRLVQRALGRVAFVSRPGGSPSCTRCQLRSCGEPGL